MRGGAGIRDFAFGAACAASRSFKVLWDYVAEGVSAVGVGGPTAGAWPLLLPPASAAKRKRASVLGSEQFRQPSNGHSDPLRFVHCQLTGADALASVTVGGLHMRESFGGN